MDKPLLELRGISKAFGQYLILDNLNLTIQHGETVAIIGPSGTGKSTILRIIAGLLMPDSGQVYLQGKPRLGSIEDGNDPYRISLVFQQAALFDSLTVAENVGFLLYQHSKLPPKRIRQLVEEGLELVGLKGIADLYPAELSGGMRKRVSFARAIMEDPEDPTDNPELLLYDEPTAGLDPIASTVIEDLMRGLKDKVKCCSTYVVVTHQETTIRRTVDRVIFVYKGRIQWQGSIWEMDHGDNPYMQQFLSGRVNGPIQVLG